VFTPNSHPIRNIPKGSRAIVGAMTWTAHHRSHFVAVAASGALVFALAACGGGAGASSQVASLGASGSASADATSTTVAADTQKAWIDFAQCMRDNGVAMKDPTFDASGNLQGGFGPDSGIDFRSDATRAAMTACRSKMPAGGPGGAGGPRFDRTAIQAALTAFTACLRDQGLNVNDIDFSAGPGGDRAGGPPTSTAGSQTGSGGGTGSGGNGNGTGSGGTGGFQGGPPPDAAGGSGKGFDPTARIIKRLGLDATDPTVKAAVTACSSKLDGAFAGRGQAGGSTTTTVPGK
jgi:hypothetical protein